MDVAALLVESFSRIPEAVDAIVDGLDVDALATRPDPEANSIAWLVWHLTRVEDAEVSAAAGLDDLWSADGWADRFVLPLDRADTGYGHTVEQAGYVRGLLERD